MRKLRIPVAEPELGEQELRNVTAAVRSGWVSSKGEFINRFEKGFAKYIGKRYGVATCNGTAALHLALVCLGVGKGDEVVVPTLTFAAVPNAVRYTGAKPIFVDSHSTYWCIDPQKIRKRISKRTKAIILVHLYGHPCDMDPILEIAQDNELFLIEDCAEAHGAEYKRKRVGRFGFISCFSFYGNKILTTGEGGMCLTDSNEHASFMRRLRDHGMNPKKRYWHDVIGFNYRMTNVEAALGLAQIERINEVIAEKRRVYHTYMELLDHDNVIVQAIPKEATHGYWMVVVLVRNAAELRIALQQQGIDSRPVFYPLNTMPPYQGGSGRYLNADKLHRYGIMLPSYPQLTDDQIQFICSIVNKHA